MIFKTETGRVSKKIPDSSWTLISFAKSASVSYSQSETVEVSQTGGNESVSDKGKQRSDCSADSDNLRSPEMKK